MRACRGHALRLIRRHRAEAARIFKCVIEPSLEGRAPQFTPPHLSLRHAYYWALCLITSRAHEHDGGAVLSPLLDLFDGTPGGPAANVDVHRGFWPFVRGAMYRNECDLRCTAAAATRDIAAGEALVVSYGEMSSAAFLLKYGCVPEDERGWENRAEVLSLTLDPALLPAASTSSPGADLRWAALRHFLERNAAFEVRAAQLGERGCHLVEARIDVLAEFARSGLVRVGEMEGGFLRQFLILLVASEELLHQFLATETIKTGGWDHAELLRALEAVLRHSLREGPRWTLSQPREPTPAVASGLVVRMARRDEALLRSVLNAISTPEAWRRSQAARNRSVRIGQAVALAVVAALLWWVAVPFFKLLLSWPLALLFGRADETPAPTVSLEGALQHASEAEHSDDPWGGADEGWATLGGRNAHT